jgi:hypothetical protein
MCNYLIAQRWGPNWRVCDADVETSGDIEGNLSAEQLSFAEIRLLHVPWNVFGPRNSVIKYYLMAPLGESHDDH